MPFDEQRVLRTSTGAALNLFVKFAAQEAHGVVQITHGLAEHAGRYGPFADFLAAHGFHVYAQDHRGHGLTKAEDTLPRMFAWRDGAKKVVADAGAVYDLVASEHPGLPVVIFGQSMGGLIALSLLRDRACPIAGAAIWNCDPGYSSSARAARLLLAWERFRLGSDAPSCLLPRFTFEAWADAIPHKRTALDWLSRDPAAVDAFIADPLCGWSPTISLWSDILDLQQKLSGREAFAAVDRALPLHLVGGGGDPATGNGTAVEALAQRLAGEGFSNLTARVYAENRHDSLNEPNAPDIMENFVAWIERNVLGT